MSEEKKKTLLIAAGVGAVIILIGLVVGLIVGNSASDYAESEYSDDELVGDTQDKFMVFYNMDILTLAYNIDISTIVAGNIESYAFSPEQMQFSGENNPAEEDKNVYYDADIDIGSFVSYDAYTSEFEVAISDGRLYRVMMQTDTLDEDFGYIYVAIMLEGGDGFSVAANGDGGSEAKMAEFVKFVEEKFGVGQNVL